MHKTNHWWHIVLSGVLVAAALVLARPWVKTDTVPTAPGKETETTKREGVFPYGKNEQTQTVGDITLFVLAPEQRAGGELVFPVTLDTHAGDLSVDLLTTSTLVDDTGRIFAPLRWEGDPPGGHHRSGTLVFTIPELPPQKIILTMRPDPTNEAVTFFWNAVE